MITYKIIITAIVLFTAAVLYQKVATAIDEHHYPPPGKLIKIGGSLFHINTSGHGKYTVVLDAGLGGTSLGWSLVQPEISKFSRVCSIDRAGYAWSDESISKRTSNNIADELHSCLREANIPGPYILVGHSFGGCNMLMFAHKYPDNVKGVVLVDSVHEEMLQQLPQEKRSFLYPRLQWFSSLIGYKRLKGPSKEIVQMFEPLPKQVRNAYIAQMNKTRYVKTVGREMECLEESLSQLEISNIYLQDKPLIVITAGLFANKQEGLVWKELQKKLLLKSSHVKHVIAENSDHMINHYQPDIIIEAISEIIGDERLSAL